MAASVSDTVGAVSSSPLGGTRAGAPPAGWLRRVSIIICTKDRRAELARALASLAASGPEAREVEIVVVEETDAPRPIPGTTYVPIERESLGFGHARNRGVAHARGDILVFFDDDCEAGTGWPQAILAPFWADDSVAGVAGAVLVRDSNLIGYAENILGFPGGGLRYLARASERTRDTCFLSTCNCAYRRVAVEEAGGFVPSAVWGGEDALLAERVTARHRCVYAPGAVVYHRPRGSLAGVFRWFVRRGRSEIQILPYRAHGRAAVMNLLWRSILLRAGVLAAALALLPVPVPVSLAVLALGYYGLMLWRYRFALRFTPHRRAWPLVPVVKVAMDLGMEVGILRQLCLALRRAAGRARASRRERT
jgi:GT2 family glycosyltransferase